MVSSIAYSLGYGSGIDVAKLVTDLAAASRDPKVARLDTRTKAVQASISAVAQARSDLENFTTSLSALVAGGTLQSQPLVSDAAILDAKARPGSVLGAVSASVEVVQLARGQTLASAFVASSSTPVGQGTVSISVGSLSYIVAIDSGHDSLVGLAEAINTAKTGVSASVVNDTAGARLVLKGPTGTASAFTLSSSDSGLSNFSYPGTMTLVQSAADAELKVDGLTYTRPTNSIDDVLPGIALTLKKSMLGSPVTIGVTRASDTLKSTLGDFVSVFNTLKGHIADARAATRGDEGLRTLDRRLSSLVSEPMTSTSPASLAAIGIKTNRDGTIAFDDAAFGKAYALDPDAVEAIFSPLRDAAHTDATDPGIGKALAMLNASVTAPSGSLASLSSRLGKQLNLVSDERARMEVRETAYKARLEKQFGNVDGRVAALKATQSYLDQQIKLWTASR